MRYKIRHFSMLFVLLSVPAFTCGVAPAVLELIQRVEVLEAESDSEFLVIDSQDAEIGDLFVPPGLVMFAFQDIRPFALTVSGAGFDAREEVYFASTDCSGTPLMRPLAESELLGAVAHHPVAEKTYVAPEVGALVTVRSFLTSLGENCIPWNDSREYGPAILIPEIEEFAPPFRVITRGEFLAMQEGGN